MDEDGDRVAEVGGGFQVTPENLNVGEKQQVPLAIDLRNVGATKHGAYSVNIYIDGNLFHETAFYVIDNPAPGGAPGPN